MSADHDLWEAIRREIRSEIARMRDGAPVYGIDAIAVPGSWDSSNGTVAVIPESQITMIRSKTEQPDPSFRVPIHAPIHGMQSGLEGGELIILHRRESGWIGTVEHSEDDSPGAPPGEVWIVKDAGSFKLTKDGGGTFELNAAHVRLGPTSGTDYALVRTIDLQAVLNKLDVHMHGPGDGINTGPPTMPFGSATGSTSTSAT